MTDIGTIGAIRITDELQDAINYHHAVFGSSTEWNGILFYKHVSGDFGKLKNLGFVAHAFYLMEDGSSSYTKNDFDAEAVVEAYDCIPDSIESLTGKIHSHHSMKAYHSTTDMKDLEHNATVYGFYISLVVSMDGVYDCKISIPASPVTMTIKDSDGNSKQVEIPGSTVILQGDLNVIIPDNAKKVPKWMSDRVTKVKTSKKSVTSSLYDYPPTMGYRSWGNYKDPICIEHTVAQGKLPFASTPVTKSSKGKISTKKSCLNDESPLERFVIEIMENILLYSDFSVDYGSIIDIDDMIDFLSVLAPTKNELGAIFDDVDSIDYSVTRAYNRVFDTYSTDIAKQLEDTISFLRAQAKSYALDYFINKLIDVKNEYTGEIQDCTMARQE